MNKPTVRSRHDYMSVDFGQGRVFTINRRGAKGTNLPNGVFERLDGHVQAQMKVSGNYGKAIDDLVENIDRIWPDWNEPMPVFAVGDPVLGPTGEKGKVVGKARTNIKVQFDGDHCITLISPALLKRAT